MSRHNYSIQNSNDSFICRNCGLAVPPVEQGGYHRNHCPHCLWSLHVDLKSGDRRCACRGEMEPISVWVRSSGEWSVIHRCGKCGFIRSNRIAADDNERLLFVLAARPMTMLPFPAKDALEKLA